MIITGTAFVSSTIDAALHFAKNLPIKVVASFSAGAYPKWFQNTGITHIASLYLENISHKTLLHNDMSQIFSHPCYIVEV